MRVVLMADDDRPRRSWREIDRRRESGASRQDERPSGDRPHRGQRSQKSYRAALDRLFESGKIGKLVQERDPGVEPDAGPVALLKPITTAEGRDTISKAVDAYLEDHELPQDFEVLTKVLEHRDPERQRDALVVLEELTRTQQPKRARALVGQLKLLRDTEDDPEIATLANQLIDRLD